MTTQALPPRLEDAVREVDENQPETALDAPLIEITVPHDPSLEQMMRIVEVSGTLDFWDDPREDIYSLDDGEPL